MRASSSKAVSRTARHKMAEMNGRANESLTAEQKKEVAKYVVAFETASTKRISVRIYNMLGKPYPLTATEEKVVEGLRNLQEKMAAQDAQDEPSDEINGDQSEKSDLETSESDRNSGITVISKSPISLSANDGVSGAAAQQPIESVFSPRQMRLFERRIVWKERGKLADVASRKVFEDEVRQWKKEEREKAQAEFKAWQQRAVQLPDGRRRSADEIPGTVCCDACGTAGLRRQEDCFDYGDPFHERQREIYIERLKKGLIQRSSHRGRSAYR